MKPGLQPGAVVQFEIEVSEGMRPAFDGQVVHDVLSTVSMIYYMERAGRHLILPYLEDWEEGAGLDIQVKHMGPAVVGQKVTIKAICTEVTDKRVMCEVSAATAYNAVGIGTFTQALFHKKDMDRKLQQLQLSLRQKE